jgi:Na+/alanine symporter
MMDEEKSLIQGMIFLLLFSSNMLYAYYSYTSSYYLTHKTLFLFNVVIAAACFIIFLKSIGEYIREGKEP